MDHGRITRCLLALVLMLLATGLPSRAQAAAGWLDSSFGTGGKVTTAFGSSTAYGVALQPDGKIVTTGTAVGDGRNYDVAVVRYHANGTPDESFGLGGKVTTGFAEYSADGSTNYATGYAVAIQTNGKIVVAGSLSPTCEQCHADVVVVRYNADGSLDESFGTGGKATAAFPGSYQLAGNSMALQADGGIVVAGHRYSIDTSYDFAMVHFNAAGVLDTSFGTAALVATDFFGHADGGSSVAIQAGGKIVVAGFAASGSADFAIARYNADGSPDTGFGTGGKLTTDFFGTDDFGHAMTL